MKSKIVVAFCMDLIGHFHRLIPVISNLAKKKYIIYFFSHSRFQREIEEAGGIFVNLLTRYPLQEADQESIPLGCRFVTYTGKYIKPILEEVKALDPCLVIYDSFAVIGFTVARVLDLPFINICAGHNINSGNIKKRIQYHPFIKISKECHNAVITLREIYGIESSNPFLYACSVSPYLNIYSEPPLFLDKKERKHYEPLAFFGCIDVDQQNSQYKEGSGLDFTSKQSKNPIKIYVSFGTIIWIYFAEEAANVLQVISEFFSREKNTEVIISLGGHKTSKKLMQSLRKQNINVNSYVDQWKVLQGADLFITHHGLNSTHEAIFNGVPMMSYPFFWDQPALAAKCQNLGIAIPLVSHTRKPITNNDVKCCFENFLIQRKKLLKNIRIASDCEKQTMNNRAMVIKQIEDIIKKNN